MKLKIGPFVSKSLVSSFFSNCLVTNLWIKIERKFENFPISCVSIIIAAIFHIRLRVYSLLSRKRSLSMTRYGSSCAYIHIHTHTHTPHYICNRVCSISNERTRQDVSVLNLEDELACKARTPSLRCNCVMRWFRCALHSSIVR